MIISAPSALSLGCSLHGNQICAPFVWHDTLTHGNPSESFDQVTPPSHGGFLATGVSHHTLLLANDP